MADIKYYDVILKPVITEKSMAGMGEKKYTFLVHTEANKSQIKEAVEKVPRLRVLTPSIWMARTRDAEWLPARLPRPRRQLFS